MIPIRLKLSNNTETYLLIFGRVVHSVEVGDKVDTSVEKGGFNFGDAEVARRYERLYYLNIGI